MTKTVRPLQWDRLLDSQNPDGGWGYRTGAGSSAEPTALICLALYTQGAADQRIASGLHWLAQRQNHDGGVAISPSVRSPCWPTGLAMVAWALAGRDASDPYAKNIEGAAAWLSDHRGEPVVVDASVFGHDASRHGWPWVAGTHSWVEPTAYAVLGLRAARKTDHPHYQEGVRVLLDRALPNGGWNYGNTRVFGNILRPFPATTGIVLTALAGEPSDPKIAAAVNYLTEALDAVSAPMSIAWALIGLRAWSAHPPQTAEWLARCDARAERRPPNLLETALLLLAAAEQSPFRFLAVTAAHE
jgi:hypothetical protein